MFNFDYTRTPDEISLGIESSGASSLEFAPALSLRAKVLGADLNGKRVQFQELPNDFDQHASVRVPLSAGKSTLRIRLRDNFGIAFDNVLPNLGSRSQGLRIISEEWSRSHDVLTLQAEGLPGAQYELAVLNPGQIASVEGAEVRDGKLSLRMPSNASSTYAQKKIEIHFAAR